MQANLILRSTAGGNTNTVNNAPLTHAELDQNFINLDLEIDGKSALGHQHAISDVTGLQAALNGKAATLVAGTNIVIVGSTISTATDVITATSTQNLSNKAIPLGLNTITGTIAQFNAALTDGDFATITGTETLSNKTMQMGQNTLTGTLAQLNTAITDADVASLAGTETLSNKTLIQPVIHPSASGTAAGRMGYENGSLQYGDGASQYEIGFRNIPQNSRSAAYTCTLSDAGKHILHPSADTTARTFTIPSNASVPYPIGTAITFVNQNAAGTLTISITSDTIRLAGAGITGSRILQPNGIATAMKITSTEWIISGTGLQ